MKLLKTIFAIIIAAGIFAAMPSYASLDIPPEAPEDIQEPMVMLSSNIASERAKGAAKLDKKGERATLAIPFLIAVLGDNTPLVSSRKPRGKRNTSPSEEAGRALSNIMTSQWELREDAKRIVPNLIYLLEDADVAVRGKAAATLGPLRDRRALAPLLNTLLDDFNADVRAKAAYSLGQAGDLNTAGYLIDILSDNRDDAPKQVIAAALKSLSGIGYGNKPEKWEEWLEAKQEDARSIKTMISRLKSSEGKIRIGLSLSLQDLTGVFFGVSYEKWSQWWEANKDFPKKWNRQSKPGGNIAKETPIEQEIGDFPAEIMPRDSDSPPTKNDITTVIAGEKWLEVIQFGDAAVDPLIVTMLYDDSPKKRSAALRVLGNIKTPKAIEALIDLLYDTNEHYLLRQTAALTLGEIGSPLAEKALAAIAEDVDDVTSVRVNSVNALGALGTPGAIDTLVSLLDEDNEDSQLKSAAVRALGETKSHLAIEPLISVMNDSDPAIKANAAGSLERITGQAFGVSREKWLLWWEEERE